MNGVLIGHQIGFPSLVWPEFSMFKVPFCFGGQSTRIWEDVVRGRQQAWRWIRTGTGTRQLLTEPPPPGAASLSQGLSEAVWP